MSNTPRSDRLQNQWSGEIRTEGEIWNFARELERELNGRQWQPIDTAYTYENVGKRIIIMDGKRNVRAAMMLSGSLMTDMETPLFWMPLQAPPTQ